MIQISEAAQRKIASLKSEEGQPSEAFLRVSVKEGGCSGFSYKMDFDSSLSESDKSFPAGDIRVVVDSKSLLYLLGMTLDFEGGLNGKGFIFNNPNATKKCGCGTSFAV